MNNKKLTAIENIVAATATYAKTLMDVEEVIKFADIEKTCELLDIKDFVSNIQIIRSIIEVKNDNNGADDDDEDVGVTPIVTVVNTTPVIDAKPDENIREDIDLTCDFISYDKPHVVKHDQHVLNLMGKVYKTVRVSALDHLLLVREDGAIFDYLGNQIVVSTYINGNGNKIKLTMPNGKLTHMSAIPIIADAWVEKKRKGDIYPRIVDTQKPATPDNIIWYDRKIGPVKVPPEYNVSTTPQSTTNWKYRHEADKTADTDKKTKPAVTPISYSIEYEIPVVRQLNRYRGSIKKVYDELKDQGSSVTLFDIFNIKEDKFGTTDDDLSVLVRDIVEECHYDMNRIGDIILKNTNKIISHTQRRLIRKLAKKAGVEVVEETEKFPEMKKIEQKNERELEIANVLKRLDWNILQAFLHMRATPTPATMFQIYKVKEKYYSTDESDVRAVAINIHRSMGISDWRKISEMLDKEIGVTVNPEKIESWIDNYNNYIQRKRGEAASSAK
jgi:hypothetical protein